MRRERDQLPLGPVVMVALFLAAIILYYGIPRLRGRGPRASYPSAKPPVDAAPDSGEDSPGVETPPTVDIAVPAGVRGEPPRRPRARKVPAPPL
ncbi:MAG TPA: hypothetical protein VNI01_08515 [Elusimicrobiota bacterium]|jgi:hypothetical protein|nr:hypothetical protein [Elusimicrobiota bacterium]